MSNNKYMKHKIEVIEKDRWIYGGELLLAINYDKSDQMHVNIIFNWDWNREENERKVEEFIIGHMEAFRGGSAVEVSDRIKTGVISSVMDQITPEYIEEIINK